MDNKEKLDISNLKKSVIIYIMIGIVLLITISLVSVSFNDKIIQEKKQTNYSKQISSSIKHVVGHFLRDYTYRALRIVKTTHLAELLENEDRDAVLKLLKPKFDLMKEESKYVTVMHVHKADGTSFLRVHKPDKFGDNIAKYRVMLRDIYKNHKTIFGYETGIYATVYRVIIPIFNKENKYIGAFEIGVNPNFIVEAIHEINGLCGMALIKDTQLKLYSKPNDVVIDGYRVQTDLNEKLKNICKMFKPNNKLEDHVEIIVNGKKYLTHLLTLKNFNQEDSVKIIFFQNITGISDFIKNSMYKFYSLMIIVLLIITYFIYRRIEKYQNSVSEVYNEQLDKIEFNQNYLQAVFDATPHIMITTDGTEINRANPAMLKFFDYKTLADFKNEHECICDYFLGDNNCLQREVDGVHWLEYIFKNPDKLHKVCMNKGDKRYHFVVNAHYLELASDNQSIVTFNDVTELEELGERLEIAVDGTSDGLWDWNLVTNEVYFSPRWKEMLGYKDDELKNEFDTWESRVHPDDLKVTVDAIIKTHIKPNIPYENIHRLRHKNGSWVWILDRGQTKFDDSGKAIRMVGFHTDITKQKELELELRDSQHQFEQFMENMPASIIIKDENFKIIYANNIAKSFFNDIDIIGLKSEDILSKEDNITVNRLDKEILTKGLVDSIENFTNYNNEKQIYRIMGFVIKDRDIKKIGTVSVDITKEFTLEQELKKELEKSQQLGEFLENSINEIYIFTRSDFKFSYLNRGAKENIGYTFDEMKKLTPLDIKPNMTLEKFNEYLEPIVKNEVDNVFFTTIHQRKDTSTYPVDVYLQSIVYEEIDSYIAIIINTTQREKIKQELKDKDELMIAQSRHAAMGEMISMIAHQWRQPISAIAMEANNILADIELGMIDTESLKEDSEDIIKQTQELSKTIDDFREFFKPDKLADNINIKDVLNDVLGVMGKSLENNAIKLSIDIDDSRTIKTYSRELMQVMINIIKNAKEALVEKEIEDKKISIVVEYNDNVIIKIQDNAGGIDMGVIDKIFDPYFTTKGKEYGTGLGLYMSKTIVEKHLHGVLTASNVEDGACFEIKLHYDLDDGGGYS